MQIAEICGQGRHLNGRRQPPVNLVLMSFRYGPARGREETVRIRKTDSDKGSNRKGATRASAACPAAERTIRSMGVPLLDLVVVLGIAAFFAVLFLSIRAVEKL